MHCCCLCRQEQQLVRRMLGTRRLYEGVLAASVRSLSAAAGGAVQKYGTKSPHRKVFDRPLIKPRHRRPCVMEQRDRNFALDDKAKYIVEMPYRLISSVVLHCYPRLRAEKTEWEKEYERIVDEENARRREWFLEQTKGHPDAQYIPDVNPSYEEIVESMPFKPASRITEADEKNDRKSTERRMGDSLYLIVKRHRNQNSWQFPQGKWKEGETLRQTAQRVLQRAVGKVRPYFIGNAPIGHYKYEYPEAMQIQRKNFGAHLFFHRAQYIRGDVNLETKLYADYAWVAKDEMHQYFDADTNRYLQYLLMD